MREVQALLLGGAFGLSHLRLQRSRFASGMIPRSGKSKLLMNVVLTSEAVHTDKQQTVTVRQEVAVKALRVEAVTASRLRV